MTEIDVYRFCMSLLNWEGVHLVGEQRVDQNIRVLLGAEEGPQQWCNTLEACDAFRAQYGERI